VPYKLIDLQHYESVLKKKKKNSVEITCWENFKIQYCTVDDNSKKRYSWTTSFEEKLFDFESYVNLLIDFEKLKDVLFNEEQFHTFRLSNKIQVNVVDQHFISSLVKDKADLNEQKQIDLLNYYINKIVNNQLTEIDIKLMKFLDSEYRNVIIDQTKNVKSIKKNELN
jgi:hypothetical protein